MIDALKYIDVVQVLSLGAIGLGFILAILAYLILTKEQKVRQPRSEMLKATYVYMGFSVVIIVLGLVGRFVDRGSASTMDSPPKSAKEQDELSQQWRNVDDCIRRVFNELRDGDRGRNLDSFMPGIIVAELGPDLILGQLLIREIDSTRPTKGNIDHPRTYVLYELPPNSIDKRYDNFGHRVIAGSNKMQYFIPHALLTENSDENILIFDAFAKTGATLRDIKGGLHELGFKKVRTAVMGASKKILDKGQEPDHVCFLSNEFEERIPLPFRGSLVR